MTVLRRYRDNVWKDNFIIVDLFVVGNVIIFFETNDHKRKKIPINTDISLYFSTDTENGIKVKWWNGIACYINCEEEIFRRRQTSLQMSVAGSEFVKKKEAL